MRFMVYTVVLLAMVSSSTSYGSELGPDGFPVAATEKELTKIRVSKRTAANLRKYAAVGLVSSVAAVGVAFLSMGRYGRVFPLDQSPRMVLGYGGLWVGGASVVAFGYSYIAY